MPVIITMPELITSEQPFNVLISNESEAQTLTISLKVENAQREFKLEGGNKQEHHEFHFDASSEKDIEFSDWGTGQVGHKVYVEVKEADATSTVGEKAIDR